MQRHVHGTSTPFKGRQPNQQGIALASVLRIIRRNYSWAACFFPYCHLNSWVRHPNGQTFTPQEFAVTLTAAMTTDALSDHEMQWIFHRVSEAERKGLNPR